MHAEIEDLDAEDEILLDEIWDALNIKVNSEPDED